MRIAPPSAFALWLLTAGTIAVIIKATRALEISFMLLPMPVGGAIPHSLMIVQNAWALALNPRQSPRVAEYRGSTYVRSQRSISASYCTAADMARTWPRCGHCEVTLKREDAATSGKEVDAQALSVGASTDARRVLSRLPCTRMGAAVVFRQRPYVGGTGVRRRSGNQKPKAQCGGG